MEERKRTEAVRPQVLNVSFHMSNELIGTTLRGNAACQAEVHHQKHLSTKKKTRTKRKHALKRIK